MYHISYEIISLLFGERAANIPRFSLTLWKSKKNNKIMTRLAIHVCDFKIVLEFEKNK